MISEKGSAWQIDATNTAEVRKGDICKQSWFALIAQFTYIFDSNSLIILSATLNAVCLNLRCFAQYLLSIERVMQHIDQETGI